jgi:serine/threonine-protein kinase
MSGDLYSGDDRLPLSAKQRIDRICLLFEDAWDTGRSPRAEEYLGEVSGAERVFLLRELLRLETHYRRGRGETLDAEEYCNRFPDDPRVVAAIFGPVAVCQICSAKLPQPSAHCPHCGAEVPTESATQHSLADEGTGVIAEARGGRPPSADRVRSGGEAERRRLLPGKLLADRYRIAGLLGRGGMGEVYRVDDLKLGQPLALKFLPERLAGNPDILELFHNEVRLARQVSHPNVCRVHDIGEVDGQHFLSMEYVDGEDLAGLLRQIGRFPPDKGLTIARQLLAGLAAAHEQGILHRDLKPGNVMLDGRGHVRITDFGVACLSETAGDQKFLVGTPRYMAPEQLAGEPVTVRSDLYAVGLILYEAFTGQPPFQDDAQGQLARAGRKKKPVAPSSIVEGLEPPVERVILRCLEADPQDRPASASAVLAALPGASPLEAAIAAGETPSPQMVAAAGQAGGLRPAAGALCLLGVLAGLLVVAALSDRTTLIGRVELQERPDALAKQASEIIRDQGYEEPPLDRAYGFAYEKGQPQLGPIYFWYRQSPSPLVPELFAGWVAAKGRGTISLDDPPPPVSGEVAVRLDLQGRLIALRAFPSSSEDNRSQADVPSGPEASVEVPNWCEPLFGSAELVEDSAAIDRGQFRPLQTTWTAAVCSDARGTWEGWDGKTNQAVRIEAAALGGRPVYFRLVPSAFEGPVQRQRDGHGTIAGLVLLGAYSLMLTLAALLARRNLRAGRGDRQGAFRLAAFLFAVSMLAWLFRTSRAAMLPHWTVCIMGVEYQLFWSLSLWMFFLALEPSVRRLWPQTLISWNRLLFGRFRDPLVGRDLLVGVLFGVGTRLLWQMNVLAPAWFGLGTSKPFGPGHRAFNVLLGPLLGGRYCAGEVCQSLASAIRYGVGVVLLLLLLRLILRRQWLAIGVYVLYNVVVYTVGVGHPTISWLIAALVSALFLFLLLRFGLLAAVSYTFVRILLTFPITADLDAWHAGGTTLLPLGLIAALAAYGFYLCLAGRPLIRDPIASV